GVQQVGELALAAPQPRRLDRIGTDHLHCALHEAGEEIFEVWMPRGQSGDGELHAVVSDFAFALARRLRVVRAPDLGERLGELTNLPPVDVALAGAINEGPGCRLLA